LARVHGRVSITDHELELLRRVVLSSMPVDRAEVLSLFQRYSEGLTSVDCEKGIGKSRSRATQLLKELEAVKLVIGEGEPAGRRYCLTPELAALILKPVEPLNHVSDLM
jgi:DNA-binding IclR family transcriptional regulator